MTAYAEAASNAVAVRLTRMIAETNEALRQYDKDAAETAVLEEHLRQLNDIQDDVMLHDATGDIVDLAVIQTIGKVLDIIANA